MRYFKIIFYPFEYIIVHLWMLILSTLSFKSASDLGGKFFTFIGMKLKVSDVARKNLKTIFPRMKQEKIETIVQGVWDNLGRVSSETPAFLKMPKEELKKHFNVIGAEHIQKLKGKKALIFTAHIANWEAPSRILLEYGIKIHAVYREANNKLVDSIINNLRIKLGLSLIPKNQAGAKKIISALRNNEHVLMLIDQKMKNGIKIPFMGKDALTAPAIAALALKYECPIIPIHAVRKDKYNFDIIIEPAVNYSKEDSEEDIMIKVNKKVEEWVRAQPDQWLWLHNRWEGWIKKKPTRWTQLYQHLNNLK